MLILFFNNLLAGYLKNEEVQNFVDKYIMPKINNDIFTNQNDNDSSKKELKYYLKKFFIKNSEKFKASEHLNNTEFNIKMENLMEYINREYDLKIWFIYTKKESIEYFI